MIPETQRLAWEQMRASRALSACQWRVYDYLARCPGQTRNEVDRDLGNGQPNATYSRRLAELERMGALRRGPARRCTVSGRLCEAWFITGQPATKPPKRRSRKAVLESAFVAIKALLTTANGFPPDHTVLTIRSVVEKADRESAT